MFNNKKIRYLRNQKKYSQRQLADKLNVGESTVGMWESGKRTPSHEFIPKLAEIFGVTIDYFYDIERKDVNELPQYDEEISKDEVQQLIAEYVDSLDWSDERKKLVQKQIDSLLEDDN